MSVPVLWQFTGSHFNEKARWALDWKGVRHERRSLLPGPHALKIWRMTGQTSVPVLELDGRAIHDSTRIIEALEEEYPEPPLYPRDEAERRRALELEDFFDEELGPHIRRFAFDTVMPHADFAAGMFTHDASALARSAWRLAFPLVRAGIRKGLRIDREGVELSRRKTFAALDRLEREIGPSGYLVGDSFTVADLTAAALLSPIVAPPEFPYPPPPNVPQSIAEFRDSLSGRPAFRWVEQMYRRHRAVA